MSENTRKVFDSREQEVKDLSLVIQTITPVISLIREWGATEKQFVAVKEEIKKLKEEIDALDATIKLVKGDIVSALTEEHDQRCEALKKIREKREKLEKACENFEGEVISYQQYTQRYKWANESHIRNMLRSNPSMTYEYKLALMFFAYNSKSNIPYDHGTLYNYMQENVDKAFFLKNWNIMIKTLKANEI